MAAIGAIPSPTMRWNSCAIGSFRRELEYPGEDQRGQEADREHRDDGAQNPARQIERRQYGARHLHGEPGAHEVEPGYSQDVAAFELVDDEHGWLDCLSAMPVSLRSQPPERFAS